MLVAPPLPHTVGLRKEKLSLNGEIIDCVRQSYEVRNPMWLTLFSLILLSMSEEHKCEFYCRSVSTMISRYLPPRRRIYGWMSPFHHWVKTFDTRNLEVKRLFGSQFQQVWSTVGRLKAERTQWKDTVGHSCSSQGSHDEERVGPGTSIRPPSSLSDHLPHPNLTSQQHIQLWIHPQNNPTIQSGF